MHRGALWAIVPAVTKESDTTWRLRDNKAELTTLPPLLSGCEGSVKSDTQRLALGLARHGCLINGEVIIPLLQMRSLDSSAAGTWPWL